MTLGTGKLGSADLAAATDTLLMDAQTLDLVVNVRLCNRNAAPIKIRIAIGAGVAPAAADYIEYDSRVEANGVMENTGLAISAGEKIWVRADVANVSARAHGIPVN
jgi:hypothetical protein